MNWKKFDEIVMRVMITTVGACGVITLAIVMFKLISSF